MTMTHTKITHCRNGHSYTEANTYVRTNGTRACKECNRQRSRNRYRKFTPAQKAADHAARLQRRKDRPDGDRRRARYLLKTYGIAVEQYELMLEQQAGRCAICRNKPQKRRLHVDHDHKTGKIRGLLCLRCNHKGLSGFQDNIDIVENAYVYMERAEGRFGIPFAAELLEALQ